MKKVAKVPNKVKLLKFSQMKNLHTTVTNSCLHLIRWEHEKIAVKVELIFNNKLKCQI